MAIKLPLHIVRGKTLVQIINWANGDLRVSKPITGIDLSAGFPRLAVAGHGLPNGWPTGVVAVKGMKQINSTVRSDGSFDERTCYRVTVIDANTIELNGVTPVDDNGVEWPAYVSGGFVIYDTPMDFTSYTPEVVIKDKIGGTILLSSRVADAPLNLLTATKDNATKQVIVTIPADVAAAITWKKAVWEVEMRASAADVKSLIAPSDVTVGDEVVT